MTNNIDLTRTNKTIISILSKFPPIQNNSVHEYFGVGSSVFYGLKSSDFNEYTDFENGDRIFNHWRDKLVGAGLLIKVRQQKKRGSPYAITPLGVAYLVQNSKMDKTDILNCINVAVHYFKDKKFDKTTFEFNKIIDLFPIFVDSFNLIKFEKDVTVIQTRLYFNIHLDLYQIAEEVKNINFAKIAYYLIGNLCWLILSTIRYGESQTLKNDKEEYKRLKKTSVNVMPKGIMMFGKVFSQEISDLLDIQSKLVNQIIK